MSHNNPSGTENKEDGETSSHVSPYPGPPSYSNVFGEGPIDVLPCASMSQQPPSDVKPMEPGYVSHPSAGLLPLAHNQVQPYQPFFSDGQQVTTDDQPAVVDSFVGQIIYSCIVAWCFNVVFGVVAFALARAASNRAVSDSESARKLGRLSYAVATSGIIVTSTIVGIVIRVYSTTTTTRAKH